MKVHTPLKRQGLSLVLSSPSGAGKTTLARMLLQSDPNIQLSISTTTRAPRPGEVNGKDYSFVDERTFMDLVKAGEMLEHAKVFDHYYGSPKKPVMDLQAAGQDVLFDIDWQGSQQLYRAIPDTVVSIFILPPSAQALHERLKKRAEQELEKQQNAQTQTVITPVEKRMAKAHGEIEHWQEYDYVLINDVLEETLEIIKAILESERHKRTRNTGLVSFVQTMQEDIQCHSTS
jgi:guanylate kinase